MRSGLLAVRLSAFSGAAEDWELEGGPGNQGDLDVEGGARDTTTAERAERVEEWIEGLSIAAPLDDLD